MIRTKLFAALVGTVLLTGCSSDEVVVPDQPVDAGPAPEQIDDGVTAPENQIAPEQAPTPLSP